MGSISGLKSILLLVDLCTCRISDQNQSFKMFHSKRFFLVEKYIDNKFYGVVARGLDNSPLVITL